MHPATIAPLLFKSHRKVIESKGLRSSRSAALRRFKPPSRLWPHSDMLKKEKKINFGCAVLSGILPATQLPILLVATKSTACGSNLGTEKSYEDAGNSGSFIFDSGIGVRLHRKKVAVGEDAFFASSDGTALGVADGVGGWILRGIDPGEYARTLMAKASEEANANANNRDPLEILQKAYDKVMALGIKGSTTACVVTIVGRTLYSANLGDSGYMVIRKNAVLYKSGDNEAQQHGFNYPFQLGTGDDIPTDAFEHKIQLQEGDVVVLGSDGLFDNVFPEKIIEEVLRNQAASVQQIAERLTDIAFQNSVSEEKITPWGTAGGKEDDITAIVARVKLYVPSFFKALPCLLCTTKEFISHLTCIVPHYHLMNHDVKRSGTLSDKQKGEAAQKIKEYITLRDRIAEKNRTRAYDEDGLNISGKLLEQNPDLYTMWNYRRKYIKAEEKTKSGEQLHPLLKNEIDFTKAAIMRNPKSYWVWHHRRLMCTWLDEKGGNANWKREVELCNLFLEKDSRNFHCWAYRRFVTAQAKVTDSDEFAYTTKKILENFSNYSAWHQRSVLLVRLHASDSDLRKAISDELEWIKNAFFTDPDDQAAWIYMRWLLTVLPPAAETISAQIQCCDELLEIAPNSKWALVTRLWLQSIGGLNDSKKTAHVRALMELDPAHVNYYQTLL